MKVTNYSGVRIDEFIMDDESTYWRLGKDNWYEWMGESLEPIYNSSDELEEAYNEYIKVWKIKG